MVLETKELFYETMEISPLKYFKQKLHSVLGLGTGGRNWSLHAFGNGTSKEESKRMWLEVALVVSGIFFIICVLPHLIAMGLLIMLSCIVGSLCIIVSGFSWLLAFFNAASRELATSCP